MLKPDLYKHIIWDWNGTLLNDAWLFVEIMNGVLDNRNMDTITLEKYRKILIPNEGYKTEGCPIPYKDLENICLKKIKLQKGEDYSDLFSK